MLRHPALKAHLAAGAVPGEGVVLVSEDGSWTLQGALFEQLLPLLDGTRTPEEIAGLLAPARPAEVYYVLEFLEKRGHVADRQDGLEGPAEAYWTGLGLAPGPVLASLRSRTVRIRAAGSADPVPFIQSLEEMGLRPTTGTADLEVAVTDDYLRRDLLDWALAAREARRPWLVLRPFGRELWIGPLFRPDGPEDAGCFACLRQRLRRNQQVQEFLRSRNGWRDPLPTALAALPAVAGAACRIAALEAAKALAGAPGSLDGKLLSLDTRTWASKLHDLVRHPACPICGDPVQGPPGPVRLEPRRAAATEGSGHRTTSPEATLERYGHLISPILGLVSGVESPPGTGGVFQVCVGGANGALPLTNLEGFKAGFRHRSAGKGPTLAQARASALAETLERYSTEYTGAEHRILGSLRELGDRAIHPNAVMGFSERQYRERDAWNARNSRFNQVPAPLDPNLPIPWSPVWSLTEARERLLPTQFLFFAGSSGMPEPFPPCCRACSNGNAAGNNLEEAVLQGFLELVERDATAVWWYNRLRRPAVDLGSFRLPYLADLAAHYDGLDRDLWALDLTHDLGIPAFAAVSMARATRGQILYGLGCSLDPSVALVRAFAELNQFVAGIGPKAQTPLGDEETLRWLRTATLDGHPHLAPAEGLPARTLADFPNAASGDLLEDIRHCQDLVAARGLEMLVLDLTRADARMPVAKVVVPGLRHFWARFAPGRLYDVPVTMGWLERPLSEDELNPVPVFI